MSSNDSSLSTPGNMPDEVSEISGELPGGGVEEARFKRRAALWRIAIVTVIVLFVGFLMIALRNQNATQQRASGQAPDFEITSFDGETIRLSDLKGKGVVLNFWASWCVPCRDEAPLFEATWQREKDNGIVFIGMDYLDQDHAAKAFLAEFGVTYPNGADLQSAAARKYGITGVPETFFIAPDGVIRSHFISPITSQAELDRRLDEIRP
jgi:cytochrome c biogenesis protein CcmG/thiol:disulfide interchange protein DsbE